MPRDLEALAKENTLNDMPELTKSPEDMDGQSDRQAPMVAEDEMPEGSLFSHMVQRNDKRDELHPYVQTLSPSDVESCVRVEEAAFPSHERATREKFQYRLKSCGHLSLGIFTSVDPTDTTEPIPTTTSTSTPVYSGSPSRKSVLLGHILATKTTNPTVTDSDMAIPDPSSSAPPDPTIGHKEEGRTLCIHSLAVLPQYQGRGLGKTLMKAYLQRMEAQGVASKVALISHEALIPFYESLGFRNLGESQAQFGGGGWFDLVRELEDHDAVDVEDEEDEDGIEAIGGGGD